MATPQASVSRTHSPSASGCAKAVTSISANLIPLKACYCLLLKWSACTGYCMQGSNKFGVLGDKVMMVVRKAQITL